MAERRPASPKAKSRAPAFTRMSAQDFLRSQGAQPAQDAARDKVLRELGLSARPGRVSKAAAKAREEEASVSEALSQGGVALAAPAEKKKRQGVKEKPILTALRECQVRVEKGDNHVAILFEGARLFSLNEMFSILQYRPQVVFGYKKLWQQLARNALAKLEGPLPHFEACKLTLFRQGRNKIDRDSIEVMFKFIIDALKDDRKKGLSGLFPDDNPDVVQAAEPQQSLGEPMVGIRVEGLALPPDPDFKPDDLFDAPEAAAPSRAMAPNAGSARSRQRALALDDLGPMATAGAALAGQAEELLAMAAKTREKSLAKKAALAAENGADTASPANLPASTAQPQAQPRAKKAPAPAQAPAAKSPAKKAASASTAQAQPQAKPRAKKAPALAQAPAAKSPAKKAASASAAKKKAPAAKKAKEKAQG